MDFKKIFKRRRFADYAIYVAAFGLCLLADIITKAIAVRTLAPDGDVPLIKGVFHFRYVENPGAAFGMLKDAPWVFNSISVIAISAILIYVFLGHENSRLRAVSLMMIASGGIGNMIERLGQGYVVDFLDFRLINFAVFNVADSFVCVGAGLLALSLILDLISETKKKKAGEQNENGEDEK